MHRLARIGRRIVLTAALTGLLLAPVSRADEPAADPAGDSTLRGDTVHVEVTATRIPERTTDVPASVSVVTGEDLRLRGARDLAGALALLSGVSIAPGGDGGPISAVPELWGLREFDAFLLVVDDVPRGGAFNPSVQTLDLSDVDRIEVVRGPSPVLFGATSFTGVIHVIRKDPGTGPIVVQGGGGSYGSGRASMTAPLPEFGGFHSTVTVDAFDQGFSDDRVEAERGLVGWRADRSLGTGALHLDLEGLWQEQDPASPTPRVGTELTNEVPVDANNNPDNAKINERRMTLGGGYDRPIGGTGKATWSTRLSFTASDSSALRGFLNEDFDVQPNAVGFNQSVAQNDIFFDSHVVLPLHERVELVTGVDHLYGRGRANGGDFDYSVKLGGDDPPNGEAIPPAASVHLTDTRQFSGLYAQVEWKPSERWRLTGGSRLNRTAEDRTTSADEFGQGPKETGNDTDTNLRGTCFAGASWDVWRKAVNLVTVFADFRTAFKPAAIDFGLDAETDILAPETAHSYELGAKTRLLDGRLGMELSAFQMDMENLVLSVASPSGLPELENAGTQRMRGLELETFGDMTSWLVWRVNYSLHDARFRDYNADIGQLAGNRLEMSARDMASAGFVYNGSGVTPGSFWSRWTGSTQANWVGARWLNRRNTAIAEPYITWSAGVGYRLTDAFELRLDGWNINDQRPPVAESELGEAQYYRLPARRIDLSARWVLGAHHS